MRPTVTDIAKTAGVSTATVDRVLNNRPGVMPRTRALVHAAAQTIGYLPGDDAAPRPVHLHALLPAGTNRFIADLYAHLVTQAEGMLGVTLRITQIQGLDAPAMAQALAALPACDGIALVALNHPALRDAVRHRTAKGTPIVTLASDLRDTDRLAYIGIDNSQAGRIAGQVISRFCGPHPTGKVAIFAGSANYLGHQERELGLRTVLAEDAPALRLLNRRDSLDHRAQAQSKTAALLAEHPDLTAIYNAGGGTLGIARALEVAGRADDIVFVAHEATDQNKALLQSGTLDAVIDQDPLVEAREALATLTATARGTMHTLIPPRPRLILRESL